MTTARDLCIASLTAVRNHDRDAWLALWEDDATIEDPVGISSLDPAGKGHRGKQAIAKFYDTVIAHNTGFNFEIPRSVLCGDEVAAVVILHITAADGQKFVAEAINIYRKSPNGKLASLRSFWSANA